ncbi:hypothetical protein I4U23_031546 [Adineta vaga]|nr:hypothetical protein I4U23_031546 [Adineta vaga]
MFAPAECTISALYHIIIVENQNIHTLPSIIPLGRPLPGRYAFVFDDFQQQIVPDGKAIGELYLGGIGIFKGYFNRRDETKQVLLKLPVCEDSVYETGDLAKISEDGDIIFVGRKDFQVKLRGQRIELGIASFAQTRIYLDEHVRFAEQKTISKTAVYHMPFAFDINEGSSVSLSRLRRSLGSVLNKHASLRTRVTLDENETGIVRQKVLDLFELPILVSLQINNEQYLEEILHDEMTNSDIFNIEQGHVFRCHIVRRNSIKSYEDDLLPGDIVIFNFHHISFDGVSLYVFLQDLQRAYTTDSELEFTSLQYIDYSVYEHQLNMEESNIFWHNHLNDFTNSNVFILPCDRYPRDLNMRSGRGTTVHFELSKSLSDKIFSTAEQYKLTLFQIGLASFYVFLFKLTEQTDLCTLSVNANRYRPELEDMIGFFVNTLPYRIKIDPMLCFFRFMQEVQAQCLAILPHCHVPYQDIIANNFLSQTLFAVEQIDGPKSVDFYELSDNATLRSLVLKNQDTSAKFDLSCDFSYSIQGPSIIVSLNASLDLFDQTTIEKMARRFEFLFDNIFPSKHLYETSLLFDDDQKFLHHFNNLYANNDNIDCIHHEIIRQADKSPQMIAIILENQTLSYGELLYFAQQLGSHLVINNGVGLGHVVCQLLERSIETVIGILAIWMIGGVYAPLNSRDPEARLKTCLAMTHTRCILAHFATRNIISDPCYLVVEIDQILYHSHSTNNELCSINVIPEHLSHIVFTSGSTGTPKAVQLRHRNFVSYIHSYIIQPNEITLHHTAVTFDAHLEEIVGPLIKGGQVIILPPDAHLDMNILSTTIMRHQVTYLGGVPTQLTLLEKFIKTCNSDCLMTLRTISSGGESLLTSTVQNLLPYLNTTCQFYNCYGPAECTEGAIQYLVRKDELIFNTVVPIGQPMLHVQVHLLDDYLQPTIPSIQIGEIFIGGKLNL